MTQSGPNSTTLVTSGIFHQTDSSAVLLDYDSIVAKLAPNGTNLRQNEHNTDLKKSHIYPIWCQSDLI